MCHCARAPVFLGICQAYAYMLLTCSFPITLPAHHKLPFPAVPVEPDGVGPEHHCWQDCSLPVLTVHVADEDPEGMLELCRGGIHIHFLHRAPELPDGGVGAVILLHQPGHVRMHMVLVGAGLLPTVAEAGRHFWFGLGGGAEYKLGTVPL